LLLADTYGGNFPARANFDEDGNPLLSWRVHILPYMDYGQLYDQFHLDEPWDSEHNKKLIPMMPQFYRNPSGNSPPTHSNYLVPTGPGAIVAGNEKASFAKITDGTSNTILALEVNDEASVIWTKPDDLKFDPDKPLMGLGTAYPGGFSAALADGSVRFISATSTSACSLVW